MTRISEKKARELGLIPPAPAKYHNTKTIIDGIKFASKHEARYYSELKLRQRAGEITGFDLQPVFILQKGFRHNGKAIRAIKYIADFKVFYPDGRVEIVDTKGVRTRDYINKVKILLKQNPDMWFTEA